MKIAMAGMVSALALTATAVMAEETSFGPDNATETYYWISQNATLPLFVRTDYRGMKQAAEQLGVKIRIAGPTTIDLPGFIATIDQVCAQNPAGVSVVGWDPSLAASVDKCIEMGVPTVVDDADLPNSKRLTFIGTDWTTIGEEQAKAMIKALPDGGKIATMSIINAANTVHALQGFNETIKAAGDKYQVVASEDDGGDAQKAAQVTAALIAAHPDIAGLAGFDSESGAGIVTALGEAGLSGKVVVTAMEQTPEFFNTLKDGSVNAIIVQNRELFTYYAFKSLYDFHHNGLTTNGLKGFEGKPIPVNINTGVLVMTKDNIGAMQDAVAAAE
ncbi:substrate-binding domain-containing protein [Devosia algicola]|uniref:Substrate-binding domain-containing protein n=1 Tax=Devosia algicola TaxID=3026418 RepID=A0ABY7YQU7_9HYPH|nr:substrate-binding domain-containing protein [Devosia algicola]WDR03557.1 substrate-binding domain-containing protein [Devosia algicola]